MFGSTRGRRFGRPLVLALLTATGLLVGVGSASAHVTVNPGTAVAGSYTVLTFRVPNESAKAATVGLTVTFPADHPFASVSVKKQPGWTSSVTTAKLTTPITDDDNLTITQAVSSITWKADAAGKISLGQFAEFEVSVGPVPETTSMLFPTVQTYDDGSVVKWDEPTSASGEEPENPAPTLTIVAAAATSAGQTSATAGSSSATEPTGSAATSSAATSVAATSAAVPTVTAAADGARADNAARTLAVIALVIAAVALLVGVLGIRRHRGDRS